jgi:hypothetical protein
MILYVLSYFSFFFYVGILLDANNPDSEYQDYVEDVLRAHFKSLLNQAHSTVAYICVGKLLCFAVGLSNLNDSLCQHFQLLSFNYATHIMLQISVNSFPKLISYFTAYNNEDEIRESINRGNLIRQKIKLANVSVVVFMIDVLCLELIGLGQLG